ncbi:hypothetical protein AMTR_s00042p00226400 [Amborella trichopoda]|uniref:Uncharacterized protein n=1 Tax=Amborella trichopoda TaxID=13333 RepID=W1P1A5_AMBTC|nr:hypothetical protein AMTR_s00042p00226400 [Amborella trichopoda]
MSAHLSALSSNHNSVGNSPCWHKARNEGQWLIEGIEAMMVGYGEAIVGRFGRGTLVLGSGEVKCCPHQLWKGLYWDVGGDRDALARQMHLEHALNVAQQRRRM